MYEGTHIPLMVEGFPCYFPFSCLSDSLILSTCCPSSALTRFLLSLSFSLYPSSVSPPTLFMLKCVICPGRNENDNENENENEKENRYLVFGRASQSISPPHSLTLPLSPSPSLPLSRLEHARRVLELSRGGGNGPSGVRLKKIRPPLKSRCTTTILQLRQN